MNKPRAIGLIRGVIMGLKWIDDGTAVQLRDDSNFSRAGAIKVLKEAIKLLESDGNYQKLKIGRKLVVDNKKTCRWEWDEHHEMYDTQCGDGAIFSEGDARTYGYNYCPYCAGEILEVKR